jgi:opacity protein-like surface antigen
MKRIVAVALALAFVGFIACGAYAAESSASEMGSGMVKQGSERIAVMAGADYSSLYGDADATNMNFSAAVEYGYMVLDQFELALRGAFALNSFRQSYHGFGDYNYRSQDYSLDVVPKWRPAIEGNISPFIGPKLGVRYASNSESFAHSPSDNANDAIIEWGVVAGADIFLSKDLALVAEYDYTQYTMHTGFQTSPGLPVPQLGVNSGFWTGHITVKDNSLTLGLAYWW